MIKFAKGSSKKVRSPKPVSKFQQLGTIDETISETQTSHLIEQSHGDDTKRSLL
jgi:hypothetical protein